MLNEEAFWRPDSSETPALAPGVALKLGREALVEMDFGYSGPLISHQSIVLRPCGKKGWIYIILNTVQYKCSATSEINSDSVSIMVFMDGKVIAPTIPAGEPAKKDDQDDNVELSHEAQIPK
jgi:hypothetical protein